MTTLHKVTEATRKVIIGFSIGIASIIFIIFVVRIIGSIQQSLTPPPPPTMSFGKLPALIFPQSNAPQFSYTLNTLTGGLPTLPDRATVYKTQAPQANLLSFSDTQQLVAQYGFSGSATALSDSVYKWQQTTPPMLQLTYNIVSHDFSITPVYSSDPNILSASNLPSRDNAVQMAKAYLKNFSAFPDDIDETKTITALFDIQNNTLVPATSLSTAKIIQVAFFQKNINNIPIVYPDTPSSTIQVLVAAGQIQSQIVGVQFSHKTVATDMNATYPIKTAAQAFAELKNNKAYIANYSGTGNTVIITNVYLAYYAGQGSQDFAMPVIVFQGENNFYGFVSAVTDAQVGK